MKLIEEKKKNDSLDFIKQCNKITKIEKILAASMNESDDFKNEIHEAANEKFKQLAQLDEQNNLKVTFNFDANNPVTSSSEIEPSAPPFENDAEYWENVAYLVKYELLQNQKYENQPADKVHAKSLHLLKAADKSNYLSLLWENQGADTPFNRYLGKIINSAFKNARENYERNVQIPVGNKERFYFTPPFLNLQNAFLCGVDMRDFYLEKINFNNANLTAANIVNTCISMDNLMQAKSICGLVINASIIRISRPKEQTFFSSVKAVELSLNKFDLLADKTVKDYQKFFDGCNNAKEIQIALDALKKDYVSKSTVVAYSLPSIAISLRTFSNETGAYQMIMEAGKKRISVLNADENQCYYDLAKFYHG
jgi:hypothetical protein